MKRILLPTDFSENARQSLSYAAQLYANEAVEFVIINTYDLPPMPAQVTSTKLSEMVETDAMQDLDREKKYMSGLISNSDTMITCLSRKGALSSVLKNVDKTHKADLIIMSPRGEGQAGGFGSNTIAVMKSSDIPVLVIPHDQPFHPFKKIVFGADLVGYSQELLEYPLDFFVKEFDSTIEVIHFGTDDEEKNLVMDDLVERFGEKRTHVEYLQEESVVDGLNAVIKSHEPDLLVLVNRHRRFFSKIFLKSVTKKMALEAPVPVLVLHDKS